MKESNPRSRKTELFPSEFAAEVFLYPNSLTGKLEPLDFTGRRYLIPIYDTPNQRVLLKFGRQSEKSTFLGNKILTFSMLRENLQSLYVSPAEANTLTFSRDRIATPITTSPVLRSAIGKTDNNVLYKKFFNGSDIRFRNAFLNADRVRGNPCQNLVLDEIQDILLDVIPVIEETQSHSEFLKYRTYAGTPKSFDNTIEAYWSRDSTQYEWMVPCDSCGSAGKGKIGRAHV